MHKLSQRVERLERRYDTPAEVAEAARQFEEQLRTLAERLPAAEQSATEEEAAQWSPAHRAAWLMRFLGESLEAAVLATCSCMPRNPIELVHRHCNAIDLEL